MRNELTPNETRLQDKAMEHWNWYNAMFLDSQTSLAAGLNHAGKHLREVAENELEEHFRLVEMIYDLQVLNPNTIMEEDNWG